MEKEQMLICDKCQSELKKMNAHFSYLNHSFQAQVLRCVECGQVFIPEDFVESRIKKVEFTLEDK